MATLRTLPRRLDLVVIRLNRGLTQFVADIGVSIGEVLVPATPFKTGFARGNWRASLNAPASGPVSFLDPTGSATVSRIRMVAQSYSLGDDFYLVNNAEYIGDLNRGTSPQAVAGFVEAGVASGLARAKANRVGGLV